MSNWVKNNFWNFFFGIFAFVGTVMGAVAYFTWQSHQTIVRNGIRTEGTVISISRNSKGSAAPVVQFHTQEGQSVTWYSTLYSSPPAYRQDEKVTLWYMPEDPQRVTLKGIDSWLLPVIFGGFFAVFGGIGYGGLIFQWRKRKKQEWLTLNGKTIMADVTGVQLNRSVRVNGRSPWVISCQYFDKMSGKLYVFESENLWYDPEPFLQSGRKIKVLVDPNDYRTYMVDISFLPEMEN